MNLVFRHIFLFSIGTAIAGTAFIFLIGNLCARSADWIEHWMVVKRGRIIHWDEVIRRCEANSIVIVMDLSRSRPKVWFIIEDNKTKTKPKQRKLCSKGLLVIDPPEMSRISEEVARAGGRIMEVNSNSTLW